MKNLAIQVKNNLHEQLNLYNYVDRLTTHKKELIIKGDADGLVELDKHIQAVLCELIALEQKRLRLLHGHIDKNAKLSDFTQNLEPELAKPLDDVRLQLLEVMKKIDKLNRLNIYLIKNSIKWIEHSVTTIANVLLPESAAYGATGRALNNIPSYVDSSGLIEHTV